MKPLYQQMKKDVKRKVEQTYNSYRPTLNSKSIEYASRRSQSP